ncbi:aromatic amino acid lyase [Streptomyces sp. NPDC087294]|uniref:aromatic amino acid lyase n=1 Tax=Streptomyces sp. NPDC087294 TaxID=3365777 RepID=UPI00381BC2B0
MNSDLTWDAALLAAATVAPVTVAPVTVGTGSLSCADVTAVARDDAPVRLGDDAFAALEKGRAVVADLASGPTPAYGISTGFGAPATRHIPPGQRARLQRSLVRSHAAGSGPEVERDVVRGMLLRLSTPATGHTGVRAETAELLAALLSAGITPVVREYGSPGCSGDLTATLAGSGIVASPRGPDRTRVQDAYAPRCSPQVHGAARDTVEHPATVAGRELALDLRAPLAPAPATGAVVALLRSAGVRGPGPDRYLASETGTAVHLVGSGAVLTAVESAIGPLS